MNKFYALIFFTFSIFAAKAAGWVQLSDFGGTARHRTPMLTIGNKIYTGTGHYNGAGTNVLFNDWWQYDPGTGTWSQKADFGGGVCYHATGFVIGNIGYVGTGRISAGGNTLTNNFYQYDPATNTWTQKASVPGNARRGAVGFSIGDYGYIGTGETNVSPYEQNDFYKYNPATDSWTTIASLPGAGRSSSVAFTIGNYGYVGTGNTTSGASNDFWRYDPNSNTWVQLQNVGPTPRQEASGFSLNGLGYILTGDNYSSGTNYGDMWEYDPLTGQWTQLDDFLGSARRYLAATSFNGRAYAGLGTNGTNFKDFWTYDQFLSLLERDKLNVEVTAYPNPVIDELNFDINGIEGFSSDDFTIRIYNSIGQLVESIELEGYNIDVDFSNFRNGNYRYVLDYNGTTVKSGNIIKQ